MKKTLNIGSGNRTYEEYPKGYVCLNMDERADLDVVDIIGDVTDLSRFQEEEFDYLLASDILEHFPVMYTEGLLREWGRVLKMSGTLELRVPNFEAIIRHYDKNKNMQHVSWMIMGGQNYPGNFHFVVFNEQWLREICERVGFSFLSCVEEGPNIVMKVRKV
jgi:predicted SAM-dependent methyltransferase